MRFVFKTKHEFADLLEDQGYEVLVSPDFADAAESDILVGGPKIDPRSLPYRQVGLYLVSDNFGQCVLFEKDGFLSFRHWKQRLPCNALHIHLDPTNKNHILVRDLAEKMNYTWSGDDPTIFPIDPKTGKRAVGVPTF